MSLDLIRCRILFAGWIDDSFILLHYFQFKKTQKTPKREIEQAQRNLIDAHEQREQEHFE